MQRVIFRSNFLPMKATGEKETWPKYSLYSKLYFLEGWHRALRDAVQGLSRGFDWMTFRGPCQPQSFGDSVTLERDKDISGCLQRQAVHKVLHDDGRTFISLLMVLTHVRQTCSSTALGNENNIVFAQIFDENMH